MTDFLSRLPLAQHRVDRDHARRADPDLWNALRADPGARLVVLHDGRALVEHPRDEETGLVAPPRLALVPFDHRLASLAAGEPHYLGITTEARVDAPAGTAVASIAIDPALDGTGFADELADLADAGFTGLREVGELLSPLDAGLYVEALALDRWHAAHPYSPRSGAPARREHAGWVISDDAGSGLVFPRTDPAVIVTIVDADDRILLGANREWTPRRYSLLAGFVEPGESFEAAVVREVYEESGARVVDPRYIGSQPWPFPASIMVGFTCRLHPDQSPDDVRPDDDEIVDLRWFTREEIANEATLLPGRLSIARAMIEEWYGGPLG